MIADFDIFPNYWDGFTFTWTIAEDFALPSPYTFVIQESTDNGLTWEDISDILQDVLIYQEDNRRRIFKDKALLYRIKSTADNTTFYSDTVDPYAKYDKREYLIAKDIMRKESLMLDKMSGVPVELWRLDPFKRPIPGAIDPISGIVINPDKETEAIYYGPYNTKVAFTPQMVKKQQDPSGAGIIDIRVFNIRMIGFPYINYKDVIVDSTQDRRYYVTEITNVAEIRRVPIVQTLVVQEAPKGDFIYSL